MSPIALAAVLAAVVVVASMISVELGVTVALIELTLGVVVGNVFDLGTPGWLDFIAKFASIVLTFLTALPQAAVPSSTSLFDFRVAPKGEARIGWETSLSRVGLEALHEPGRGDASRSRRGLTLKVAVEFTSYFVLQFRHNSIRVHAHDLVIS